MQEALGSSPGIIKEAMKMATPTGLWAPNTYGMVVFFCDVDTGVKQWIVCILWTLLAEAEQIHQTATKHSYQN